MVIKLGVNPRRFDTLHHTKRALFVQVPNKGRYAEALRALKESA
ncbi:hypothetical protein [Peribacillus kribbensis]|nr:hypothetical protein [Peribacillus kribbensis]